MTKECSRINTICIFGFFSQFFFSNRYFRNFQYANEFVSRMCVENRNNIRKGDDLNHSYWRLIIFDAWNFHGGNFNGNRTNQVEFNWHNSIKRIIARTTRSITYIIVKKTMLWCVKIGCGCEIHPLSLFVRQRKNSPRCKPLLRRLKMRWMRLNRQNALSACTDNRKNRTKFKSKRENASGEKWSWSASLLPLEWLIHDTYYHESQL